MTQQSDQREFLPAQEIKDMSIMNLEGEDLGKVEEFFIDLEYGRVAYALVSFGGFLGMGGKVHAIPWQAFSWSPQGTKLVLNIDKQSLKDSPGFDRLNYQELSDRQWVAGVFKYFGQMPYWERERARSENAA